MKVSFSKDQKSSTPIGQSNQKPRAMVARSHEDGKEAFYMCEREGNQIK